MATTRPRIQELGTYQKQESQHLIRSKSEDQTIRPDDLRLGATMVQPGVCSFLVWAPFASNIEIHVVSPEEKKLGLTRTERGYHFGIFQHIAAGARYFLRIDGRKEFPDPASRFQPEGVHGPSEVVEGNFHWSDGTWRGIPLQNYIIYELHIGTFTADGTFEAVIPHLPDLKRLGITAVELMPVAQFPGGRNWGYDGVGLFAAQNTYGGPEGLKRLVNACHLEGIAVVLDVVYNHIGPEGNYFNQFGPYFTGSYKTPWGPALNFDGHDSDQVRRYFTENALYWQTEFHIDSLRLDAVHAIKDFSAIPFLQELGRRTRAEAAITGRPFYLIAESDLNTPRFVLPEVIGGYGLDAHWSDDFHHCLHVLLTGEKRGYYEDFGGVTQFGKVFREGYAFTGDYSPHRRRRHGASPKMISHRQFVVCAQNHDQVGNRKTGDRLTTLVDFESLKLAASAVIFSPFIPLLFMGEEHGEPAPFQFMTSHTDDALIEAVRNGRREEFASFDWKGEVPDPQAESTFHRSHINHALRKKGQHKVLFELYAEAIRVRKHLGIFTRIEREGMRVQPFEDKKVLVIEYLDPGGNPAVLLLAFGQESANIKVRFGEKRWERVFDSSEKKWQGPGSLLPEFIDGSASVEVALQGRSAAVFQGFQV